MISGNTIMLSTQPPTQQAQDKRKNYDFENIKSLHCILFNNVINNSFWPDWNGFIFIKYSFGSMMGKYHENWGAFSLASLFFLCSSSAPLASYDLIYLITSLLRALDNGKWAFPSIAPCFHILQLILSNRLSP